MTTAEEMLNVGFLENLKIHGSLFTSGEQSIRGLVFDVEPDLLDDRLTNSYPQIKICVWFPESVRAKTNPFVVGEYLEKEGIKYKITKTSYEPNPPKHWKVECDGFFVRNP